MPRTQKARGGYSCPLVSQFDAWTQARNRWVGEREGAGLAPPRIRPNSVHRRERATSELMTARGRDCAPIVYNIELKTRLSASSSNLAGSADSQPRAQVPHTFFGALATFRRSVTFALLLLFCVSQSASRRAVSWPQVTAAMRQRGCEQITCVGGCCICWGRDKF